MGVEDGQNGFDPEMEARKVLNTLQQHRPGRFDLPEVKQKVQTIAQGARVTEFVGVLAEAHFLRNSKKPTSSSVGQESPRDSIQPSSPTPRGPQNNVRR